MKRIAYYIVSVAVLIAVALAGEQSVYGKNTQSSAKTSVKEMLWPKGKMPDAQGHQVAAMWSEVKSEGFKAEAHRLPYLEWFEAPDASVRCGTCAILISGGGYNNTCDEKHIDRWTRELTALGVQCVSVVYRTPRPVGLPIYQTAWEDVQRAVRLVRSEASKRGYDPDKIGTLSMSAGSHAACLLATSSTRRAYAPVDKRDSAACNLNFAIAFAPAYVTTDGRNGTRSLREGYGVDVALDTLFLFDDKTCPMSLHHGGNDPYSPNGSTLIYKELHRRGIPAELHLYPNLGHGVHGLERGIEFLRQMGFLGDVAPEEKLLDRYVSDDARGEYRKGMVWPEGQMPYAAVASPTKAQLKEGISKDAELDYDAPYIEWHFPKVRTTNAIQIIYSGGAYNHNGPDSFEVAPVRRYLNEKGMTVVTLKYRCPRPSRASGLAKHTVAWQDLQRAIRLVRSQAAAYGLDPGRIGIMGSSAGGHLTVMGVTSSLHKAYLKVDKLDDLPCDVQWGIGIYPAYVLDDGANGHNKKKGVDRNFVPEFSFDLKTAPMLMIHGDADGYSSMGSVMLWEKMRAMGIHSELHTLATREHCFNRSASPGTGSYSYMDRIWEFLTKQGVAK